MDFHSVLTITKKELRSAFNSPIAYVFLLVFLVAVLVSFFHTFWPTDQATLRPLFEKLPYLYLLLIPALTMRIWSEERKQGTIEILLTYPVRIGEVVLGKYLAGLALIGLALLLTLGLPITVAALGNIDGGPLFGGFLGAFLLGAAYLAIGIWASSITENQILAFIGAFLACFFVWAIGEDFFTGLMGGSQAAFFEKFATGARFQSVARGVIDVRDLVYYVSLAGFFLYMNVLVLNLRRNAG